MKNCIIIGGGLLGNELKRIINEKGGNAQILKNINSKDSDLIPKETDTVFVVAQSPDYKKTPMTKDLLYVNTILPSQIALQAFTVGVKNFVYFSTGSIYQNSKESHNENEELNLSIENPYVASKYSAEILLNSWKNSFERLFIFRPFFMYGSNQNELQIIPRMIESVKEGKKIQLANNLGLILNPIHVFDAARFILETMDKKTGFQTYNLAGKEKISLRELVEKISTILNKSLNCELTNSAESIVLGSIDKMDDMGFQHKIDINEGLKECISQERPKELFSL